MKWEIKMEKVFNCNSFNEEKKVMLATSAFKDYALSWWVQIQKEWSRFGLKTNRYLGKIEKCDEGVGQIFPQEMISVIPHTNQRVELEEVVDHVHWTKTSSNEESTLCEE
ncbi:hypothetical protein Lal_00043532 [Lupinus albus]|nr:hypothetical protein Lal_00043532 [Lupinus albus]